MFCSWCTQNTKEKSRKGFDELVCATRSVSEFVQHATFVARVMSHCEVVVMAGVRFLPCVCSLAPVLLNAAGSKFLELVLLNPVRNLIQYYTVVSDAGASCEC